MLDIPDELASVARLDQGTVVSRRVEVAAASHRPDTAESSARSQENVGHSATRTPPLVPAPPEEQCQFKRGETPWHVYVIWMTSACQNQTLSTGVAGRVSDPSRLRGGVRGEKPGDDGVPKQFLEAIVTTVVQYRGVDKHCGPQSPKRALLWLFREVSGRVPGVTMETVYVGMLTTRRRNRACLLPASRQRGQGTS